MLGTGLIAPRRARYRSGRDHIAQRRRAPTIMRKGALETPSVQSVDRVLTILEAVAKSPEPVALAQLTDLLGINQSSVFRLANTLKRRGFLANPNSRKTYVLGPAIWRMSRNYEWSGMLVGICHEHLKALGEETGETAHLGVREGREVLFVDHCASTKQIVVPGAHRRADAAVLHRARQGAAVRLRSRGAAGRCSGRRRSSASRTRRSRRWRSSRRPAPRSASTATPPTKPSIREEVRCLAAPIRDQDGKTIAAIGISAPASRFPKARVRGFADHVRHAATQINAALQAGSP